jgi:predicted nucleotidyltransferase
LWNEVLPDLQLSVPFDLKQAAKVVFRVGSHSHGTYIQPDDDHGVDDVDLMVIVVPPPAYKLGLKHWEHAEFKHGKWDIVLYEWGKWLQMLRKSNPNVLGTLWLEPEDVLDCPKPWQLTPFEPWAAVLAGREKFLSKQMYPAFIGYAKGQLYKMTHHAHQGYMGEKRKRLVEKYGYDVKNAAHLVRLLRMACEAFEEGQLNVRRHDASELIAIKSGQWPLRRVQEEAAELLNRADSALTGTQLPEYPNELFIQNAMLAGYMMGWGWRTMECENWLYAHAPDIHGGGEYIDA